MGFHFMDLVVILVIGLLIFGPEKAPGYVAQHGQDDESGQ